MHPKRFVSVGWLHSWELKLAAQLAARLAAQAAADFAQLAAQLAAQRYGTYCGGGGPDQARDAGGGAAGGHAVARAAPAARAQVGHDAARGRRSDSAEAARRAALVPDEPNDDARERGC